MVSDGTCEAAFVRLGHELLAHQAPKGLIDGAARAENDELRHAAVVGRFAEAAGVTVPRARVRRLPVRSLYAVARENATVGCVEETFAAVLAHAQARNARAPALRRAFRAIAADETRHAELAWTVQAWAGQKLTARQRDRIVSHRANAATRLVSAASESHEDPVVASLLGLPTAAQDGALLATLNAALWQA